MLLLQHCSVYIETFKKKQKCIYSADKKNQLGGFSTDDWNPLDGNPSNIDKIDILDWNLAASVVQF